MMLYMLDVNTYEPANPPIFIDMVRRSHQQHEQHDHIKIEDDEEDVSDDDTPPVLKNSSMMKDVQPLLSKEEKKRMRKPWRHALIIKMFDGNVNYMALMRKLKKKMELALTDIGHKFYVVRFTNVEDYNYVKSQGPRTTVNL